MFNIKLVQVAVKKIESYNILINQITLLKCN